MFFRISMCTAAVIFKLSFKLRQGFSPHKWALNPHVSALIKNAWAWIYPTSNPVLTHSSTSFEALPCDAQVCIQPPGLFRLSVNATGRFLWCLCSRARANLPRNLRRNQPSFSDQCATYISDSLKFNLSNCSFNIFLSLWFSLFYLKKFSNV